MRRVLPPLAFAAYLVTIGLLVWSAAPSDAVHNDIFAQATRLLTPLGVAYLPTYTVIEFGSNVVLFVPLGAFLMASFQWTRVWSVTAIGLALSVLLESIQLMLPTRVSSGSDVLADTIGALLGAVLVVAVRAAWKPSPAPARVSVQQ